MSDAGGTYTGSAFSATAQVAGVNGTGGSSLEGVGLVVTYYAGVTTGGTGSSQAPSALGVYSAVAAFSGSADYGSASSATDFVIVPASPASSTWNSASGGNWSDPKWSGTGPAYPNATVNATVNTPVTVQATSVQAANALTISGGGQVALCRELP